MDPGGDRVRRESLAHVAEALRRRNFSAALQVIYKELTRLPVVSPSHSQWTALQVYCYMKLKHYSSAARQLDLLPTLVTENLQDLIDDMDSTEVKSSSSPSGVRCSYYNFLLQFMAALFPVCLMNVGFQDASIALAPFPAFNKVRYLDRLYFFVSWARQCKKLSAACKDCRPKDERSFLLYRTWETRHLLAVRCLTNCLIQLEMYEAALTLVHQEILQEEPESVMGLLMLGRTYLAQGALAAAEYHFGIAECLCDVSTSKLLTSIINATIQTAHFDTGAAMSELVDALESSFVTRSASGLQRVVSDTSLELLVQKEPLGDDYDSGWAVAVNNLAVNLLYNGQVSKSVALLEKLFFNTDKPALFFVGLRNLLTLYEFSPSPSREVLRLKSKVQVLGTDDDEIVALFRKV